MKMSLTKSTVFFLFLLVNSIFSSAQMYDGTYNYADDEINLSLTFTDDGRTISSAILSVSETGEEIGTGAGYVMEAGGMVWYEFQIADMSYEYDFDWSAPAINVKAFDESGAVFKEYELFLVEDEGPEETTPEDIMAYNFSEDFGGNCYVSDEGVELRLDVYDTDTFIGNLMPYVESMNGYADIYLFCEAGMSGKDLPVKTFFVIEESFDESESTITLDYETYVIFDGVTYKRKECSN